MSDRWQFWIDRGGTFTDVVARCPDGTLLSRKLLSESPTRSRDAVLQGIREVLSLDDGEPLPDTIDVVKMGTTVGTNALLERRGEPTALVISEGFADALLIGYQNRPRIFAREIVRPPPVYAETVEVRERVGAHGEIVTPLDEADAHDKLATLFARGIRAIAIVLVHGFRFPDHERRIAAIAGELGFPQISTSHDVSPLPKLIARGNATVVDAYLTPVLRRYVERVATSLPGGTRLRVMQSGGGLVEADSIRGKDSILSGPAGGVIGAVTAYSHGSGKLIGFDMGGTSTDVFHFAGELERTEEIEIGGVPMRGSAMRIHTVAAGGGSILSFDGARVRVGPASAGADPGPACYGRGGPLTVTDANLMVGKVRAELLPTVFGPNADRPADSAVVREGFARLAADIRTRAGDARSAVEVAAGFLEVAVDVMANAIKRISTQRGHDVVECTLGAYGGAAGQHACLVAESLGMRRIVFHPLAGVLSAFGLGQATARAQRQKSIEAPLDEETASELEPLVAVLGGAAVDALATQGVEPANTTREERVQLRYDGTDTSLAVPFGRPGEMRRAFERAHRRRFGFVVPGRAVVVETISVEAVETTPPTATLPPLAEPRPGGPAPIGRVPVFTRGREHETRVYERSALAAGDRVPGPAIVTEPGSTIVIEPGWTGEMRSDGLLVVELDALPVSAVTARATVDPVRLEIFSHLFMSVAEQMGSVLENTAHSVNIKERLDFSCALFDEAGHLVANAPHMPVHLGSMGESVRAILRCEDLRPGDVWALNAPYEGGTHLPDVTTVTPVYDAAGRELRFLVAARGHHADIGGVTPGSMPPDSTSVEEEGVLLSNLLLVRDGRFEEERLRAILESGPWPARRPDRNVADLKAQIAACRRGEEELGALVDHFGWETVRAYMIHVRRNAADHVRRVLGRLSGGELSYEMDGGETIRVSVRIEKERAIVDFTGTSPQSTTNFNAPAAVTRACVLYVFRTLVDDDIPLNEGCLDPLEIVIPPGSLLDPRHPAAVVAGNVETSQCVTDALYGALGALAASQGTMNNFTFGDGVRQYYETICGGAGAGPGFDGADAVHTHMTNSRLTDPEVLERRFPIRVEEFRVRRGSGGSGRWRGGDGAVRRIRFLAPMTAAILSGHRRIAPFGLAGGGPGATGINRLEREREIEDRSGTDRVEMRPGDVFVVETPGGGGYGAM